MLAGITLTTDNKALPMEKTDYEAVSKAVGGYIEHITLAGKFEGFAMYLNEEGKLNGLPMNKAATAIWEMCYGQTDVLVGDVVFLSNETDDEGNELPLTDEQVAKVNDLIGEAVQRYIHPSRSAR